MNENRRLLMKSLALGVTVLSTPFIGFLNFMKKKRLRPPSALDESDLLSACIKCGQCIQVCPVQALKLGDITDGFGIGVPYLDPQQQACDFSCDVVQCALACPTGALSYHKNKNLPTRPGASLPEPPVLIAKKGEPDSKLSLYERMGIARLVRPHICLAKQGLGFKGLARGPHFKGLKRYSDIDRWKPQQLSDHTYDLPLCDLCVRECPIESAIKMEISEVNGIKIGTPVILEACVGCGTCQMMCPTSPSAIEIEARGVWV